MNILLIEPDTKLAGLYKAALEQVGHEVSHVGHAQDAVHATDEKRPDVVVLELQLAAHNGVEFIYEFRSYTEWQHIPIVLLTNVPPHSLQITEKMLKDFNIVDCLYKPATNLRMLIAAIGELS